MKKLLLAATLISFAVTLFAAPAKLYNADETIPDTGSKVFNGTLASETVKELGVGWNLGNTLDATGGSGLSSETSWGMPKTNKFMMEELAKSGVKTIRMPVSWAKHMDPETYTVDQEWMKRVKTVVDMCIKNGMYVILNDHHDNWSKPEAMPACSGYYPNTVNYEESERFLYNLWCQIATTFNNGYDEHLIFETLNEPRPCGTKYEWWYNRAAPECKDAAATLNKYNQLILDAIRATGGNNQKRFVMCPGLIASPDAALSGEFEMPKDDEPGKLILSVHAYSPYKFAMEMPGETQFTSAHKYELMGLFQKLYMKFSVNGYPVIVGEYGATNKDNTEDRVAWFEFFVSEVHKMNMACCVWDNGQGAPSKRQGERYGYFDRRNLEWFEPRILEAIKKGLETK